VLFEMRKSSIAKQFSFILACIIMAWGLFVLVAIFFPNTHFDRTALIRNSFQMPSSERFTRESVYAGLKEFILLDDGRILSTTADPWIFLDVQPHNNRVLLVVDVSDLSVEQASAQIFFAAMDDNFAHINSTRFTLRNGTNIIRIPSADFNRLRLDLVEEPGISFRLNSVTLTNVIYPTFFWTVYFILLGVVVGIVYYCYKHTRKVIKSFDTFLQWMSYLMNKYPQRFLIIQSFLTLVVTHGTFLTFNNFFMYVDIGSDTIGLIVPLYHMIVHAISTGNFSFWNFTIGLGTNILAFVSVVFDPFVFPLYVTGVVFGVHTIYYMLIFTYVIQVLSATWLCYKYLSHFELTIISKLIASYLFGFSGYMMLWGQMFFFGTAAIMLVLVLFSIEKCLKNAKWLPLLAISTFILMAWSYYIGYMVLLFAGVYSVFRVVYVTNKNEWVQGIKKMLILGVGVVTGSLLSAFSLMPSIYQVLNVSTRIPQRNLLSNIRHSLTSHHDTELYHQLLLRFVSNNLLGVGSGHQGRINYYELAQYFFSSFVIIFCVFFIVYILEKYNKCKSNLKEMIIVCVASLLLIYYVTMPTASMLLNMGVRADFRSTFILLPVFAYVAARVFDILSKEKIEGISKYSLLISIAVLMHILLSSNQIVFQRLSIWLVLLLLVLAILVQLLSKWKTRKNPIYAQSYFRRLVFVFVLVIMTNIMVEGYITANLRGLTSQVLPWIHYSDSNNDLRDVIAHIDSETDDFIRLEKTWPHYFVHGFNDSMVFNYMGLSWYSNIVPESLSSFHNLVWPEVLFNNVRGARRTIATSGYQQAELAALLGIRYYFSNRECGLTNHASFTLDHTRGDINVYRNNLTEGFGILFDRTVGLEYFLATEEYQRNYILRNYLVLMRSYGVSEALQTNYEWQGFGSSSVRFYQGSRDNRLWGNVSNDKEAYLFLPIPYVPGWFAYVNGVSTDIYRANVGFMAIILDEGDNEIELIYRTPWLMEGIILSLLGLVLFIVMMLIVRSRHFDTVSYNYVTTENEGNGEA